MGGCFSTTADASPAPKATTSTTTTNTSSSVPTSKRNQTRLHEYSGEGGSGSVSPNTRGFVSGRNSAEDSRGVQLTQTMSKPGVLDRKYDFAAHTRGEAVPVAAGETVGSTGVVTNAPTGAGGAGGL